MKVSGNSLMMTRGDTEAITVSLIEDGVARPFVTGDTVYFTVKTSPSTEEKALQKVVTEFTDGNALITLIPQDTASLSFRDYVYDIQITLANGTVKTVVMSTFSITGEVTHE